MLPRRPSALARAFRSIRAAFPSLAALALGLVLLGATSGPAQGSETWAQGASLSQGSQDAGGVFDSKRNRAVIFGGYTTGGGLTNAVRAFDMSPSAAGWSDIATQGGGPDPRSRPAVAYVPTEDMMVAFGGRSGASGTNGALWKLKFDASEKPTWSSITPSGAAPADFDAQAVYDPVGNRVIVVSPTDGVFALSWPTGVENQWQWTTLWAGSTEVNMADPGFGCVYDAANDQIIVFGGYLLNVHYPYQAFAFPLRTGNPQWTLLCDTPPELGNRAYAVMVYDAERQRALLFGGESSSGYDLWELSLSGTPAWSYLAPEGAFSGGLSHQAAVYDVRSDRMAIIGGEAHSTETWLLQATPDTQAPGAVTDLNADIVGPNDILITWTAPGDDGNSGTADYYDLRIAPFSLTENTFNLGVAANPQPLTEAAGTTQEYHFSGLNACTQYYFAIKTWDEAGNVSTISAPYSMSTFCGGGGLFGAGRGALPVKLALSALGPNPARTGAGFEMAVPAGRGGENYRLEVFDVTGRRVRLLGSGPAAVGSRRTEWNLRNDAGEPVANGVYLVRLSLGSDRLVQRVAVVR